MKNKRRAFIGLSGPLAYDYKDSDTPNAILEDSLGLLILYDELLFLIEELCPRNMRHLPYVKFLSHQSNFASKMMSVATNLKAAKDTIRLKMGQVERPFEKYEPAVCRVTGISPGGNDRRTSRFIPDNHSRNIDMGQGLYLSGSSARPENVAADFMIIGLFQLKDYELVSNSGNQLIYQKLQPLSASNTETVSLGHALVLRGLPNYLNHDGPYHPCLEDLRGHNFIEEARTYLDDVVVNGSQLEVDELANEILRIARDARREYLQKHLAAANQYRTIATIGAKEVVNHLIPFSGVIPEFLEARAEEKEKAGLRWAGFVADLSDGDWVGT